MLANTARRLMCKYDKFCNCRFRSNYLYFRWINIFYIHYYNFNRINEKRITNTMLLQSNVYQTSPYLSLICFLSGLIFWVVCSGTIFDFKNYDLSFFIELASIFIQGLSLIYYKKSIEELFHNELVYRLLEDSTNDISKLSQYLIKSFKITTHYY